VNLEFLNLEFWNSFHTILNLLDLRIHLMGIGGAGMSAIARVLKARGVAVSGDDRADSAMLAALNSEGIPAYSKHDVAHLEGVDVLAPSSAISADEPELVEARRRGLKIWHRGDLLAALLRDKTAIGVAGTHGKTTTSAMIATILRDADLDPSFIIGGTAASLGVNARHGEGEPFVLEADEYDKTFLRYQPTVAIVTNVEFDHPDTFKDYNDTLDSFARYVASVPLGGVVVTCADDQGCAEMLTRAEKLSDPGRHFVDYGIQRGMWRATNVRANTLGGMDFAYQGPTANGTETRGNCSLRVGGEHNVRNALAALITADVCGVPVASASESLGAFRGAERRFEFKGEARGIRVFDDYAHHPTEIRATLAAARLRFPVGRLYAIWQPHTYSRTLALFEQFTEAFADADQVMVLPIYAAREKLEDFGSAGNALNPIEISRRIKHKHVRNAASFGDAIGMLMSQVKGGDVLITLSAGDANVIGTRMLEMLK
jgi:UDP-N-acetylmuramate--alanine ligase